MSRRRIWYTARLSAESVYGYRTLVDDDAILGAHVEGLHAERVISLLAQAARHDLRATQFLDTMFAYPTAARRGSHARLSQCQAASAKPSIFHPAAIMARRRPDMNLRVASMPPVRGQSWPV